MTEPVKFPVTGNHSPSAVYIRDISTPTSNPRLSHSLLPSQFSIKYLRADTATPNDQVEKMVLAVAYGVADEVNSDAGMFASFEIDSIVKSHINKIRSRYAASDSD